MVADVDILLRGSFSPPLSPLRVVERINDDLSEDDGYRPAPSPKARGKQKSKIANGWDGDEGNKGPTRPFGSLAEILTKRGYAWDSVHGHWVRPDPLSPAYNEDVATPPIFVDTNGAADKKAMGGVVQIIGQVLPKNAVWVFSAAEIVEQPGYHRGEFRRSMDALVGPHVRIIHRDGKFALGETPYFRTLRNGENKDGHYLGFSNGFLWWLVHGLGDERFVAETGHHFKGKAFNETVNGVTPEQHLERLYNNYKNQIELANWAMQNRFVPEESMSEKSIFLVQDYQRVGIGLVRDEEGNFKPDPRYKSVAFTLHTPFPSLDVLKNTRIGQTCVLDTPEFKEWLKALISYDVVTLHRDQDVKNLRETAAYVFGQEEGVKNDIYRYFGANGRAVMIVQNTVGIEPQHIEHEIEAAQEKKLIEGKYVKSKEGPDYPGAIQKVVEAHRSGERKHLFVVTCRRDPTKAIKETIQGIREFLSDPEHPERQKECTFLLVMQKTREELDTYKKYSQETHQELVQLQEDFPGAVAFVPDGMPHSKVMQLFAEKFAKTVLCLATRTDGFNLTGLEAVMAQIKNGAKNITKKLTLIISRGAGISDQLGHYADVVDDLTPKTLADAFHRARTVDELTWRRRLVQAIDKAKTLTGRAFLDRLVGYAKEMANFNAPQAIPVQDDKLKATIGDMCAYKNARYRSPEPV